MTPIIRLTIPILIGMIGANYCCDIIRWNNPFIITIFALLAFTITLLYFILLKTKRKNTILTTLYTLSTYSLFLLFGFILSLHSISKTKNLYGEEWRNSVYKANPLQVEFAQFTQQKIVNWYQAHGLTDQEGAIIQAMTIGYKSNISKETKEAFSKAGVSHILALSGFHVSILYIILQIVFLSHIVSHRLKWISQLFILLSLWIYASIAGMSPSLVRAVMMCTIISISSLHTHQPLSLNALALSALIHLLINPIVYLHVGFQLSYLSMLGIYFIGIPLCRLYNAVCIIDKFLWCTICISISCTLFTLPIVSYTFGYITLVSIPANIIITTLTYLIFMIFPFYLLSSGNIIFSSVVTYISHMMITAAQNISSIPLSTLNTTFTLPAIILYYSILCMVVIMMKYIKKTEITMV